jgi:outer membrane biosynthesis protein TonB
MKEPHIAARAADLAHASDKQRQGELDELVSALKRLMIDTMARENDFAALRAIDMIARLRGLVPTTAKRSDGLGTALEEMRRQQPETDEGEAEEEVEAEDIAPTSPAAPDTVPPDTVFEPPMPPELRPPVEPAPAPEPESPSPAQRASANEAARAAVRRRLFCYEHLMARHPELSGKIRDLSDAQAYFDDADNLLPPELWPDSSHPESHAADAPE